LIDIKAKETHFRLALSLAGLINDRLPKERCALDNRLKSLNSKVSAFARCIHGIPGVALTHCDDNVDDDDDASTISEIKEP
jgi:hypothetical protein